MAEHIIVGAGEVGTALASLLQPHGEVLLKDIGTHPPEKAQYLHICFPYQKDFARSVREYEDWYRPMVTVVHSTVPVGTCRRIGAVHSPIRGKHPDLLAGLKTFTKFFGGREAEAAAEPFRAVGVKVHTTPSANETEALKLWDLLQYGWAIALEKAAHDYCDRTGLDFDLVYTKANETYNRGWAKMGEGQFIRPTLNHVDGPIGGHCVVPCSGLLDDELAELFQEVQGRWQL